MSIIQLNWRETFSAIHYWGIWGEFFIFKWKSKAKNNFFFNQISIFVEAEILQSALSSEFAVAAMVGTELVWAGGDELCWSFPFWHCWWVEQRAARFMSPSGALCRIKPHPLKACQVRSQLRTHTKMGINQQLERKNSIYVDAGLRSHLYVNVSFLSAC